MFKKWVLVVFIMEILGAFSTGDAFGFGSNYTHPSLTRLAIDQMVRGGPIEQYLREELEIRDGLGTPVLFHHNSDSGVPEGEIVRNNDVIGKNMRRVYPTKFEEPYTARYLIISGAEAEDHPTERAQHHFLDPLSDKGLDNNYYGVGVLADFIALFYPAAEQSNVGRFLCSAVSLCEPSFNLDGTAAVDRVAGKTSGAYPYNYFAWPDTRRYFYNALTAGTREEREHYLALTFFSLGHNLHILEDMGVPAHTRNDFIYDHIWHGLIRGSYLEGYIESNRVVEQMTGNGKVSFDRLTDFWDTNGSQVLPGLAEYSNHNFLSEGTLFNSYEYPVWSGIERYEETAEDGRRDTVQYYTGRTSDGIEIPHLAAVGLLHSSFGFLSPKDSARHTAYLDPDCYKDYSEILIPRVVSYASGLMEYFFRGRIAVIKDGPDGFLIKNLSAEPITSGVFEIYYDSTDGVRTRLVLHEISAVLPLMPGAVTERISFHTPVNNITPGRYVIVFKGRLGNEDNAVIGKIIQDKIYFVSERHGASELYSMAMAGTDMRVLLPNNNAAIHYTHPVISPDGTRVAFHSDRDGEDAVWIEDIGTNSIKRIADGFWPDWSPDGRRVVYHKVADGKADIFIVDAESLEEERLTGDSYNNLWPAWSPDGSKVAYTSQRETKADIVAIEVDSKKTEDLTASIDGFDRWKPAWSPDGKRIAYERPTKIVYSPGEPFYVNVHTLEMDTGIEVNLTNIDSSNTPFGVWSGTPHWLNNEKIAVESNISGDSWSDLWIVDAQRGGFIRRLTDTPGHDGYPSTW
ncbi:MAG: PD40 domain-containing protein [Nitrospirae bacterium]|nr:PD40 domain-containing protein [Nitrospirota bacterium]